MLLHGVISQVGPEYPAGQEHWNVEPTSEQIPPLKHGLEKHGVISHVAPLYPSGQMQTNEAPTTAH